MTVKKVDIYRRYAFLETRIHWAGGVTAGEIGEAFGISRQSAQAVIKAYKALMPGNIRYDDRVRRHVAQPGFTLGFVREGSGPFLDYLRGQGLIGRYLEDIEWSEIPFYDADRVTRPILNDEMVREALLGLYRRRTVAIHYSSKNRAILRTISPHHLVFASNRYHLRAYCHLRHEYRDFALSRVAWAQLDDAEWVSAEGDEDWHAYVELAFRVNPVLPQEVRVALQKDYGLGVTQLLEKRVRVANRYYCERELTENGLFELVTESR